MLDRVTQSGTEGLNGDMTRAALMHTQEMEWRPSPSGTVWRRRLHLVGGTESGQVTSIVRYEPGATFPEHDHPEGEEILVLEGTFSDEHGDWGAGTHLLNPEGFRHAPFSRKGCVLFVKLRQYAGDGRVYHKTNTRDMEWKESDRIGVVIKPLYHDPRFPDVTRLERWAPGASWYEPSAEGGCEILVMEGEVHDTKGSYPAGSWIRLPDGALVELTSKGRSLVYVKTGALPTLCSFEPTSERSPSS